MAEEHSSLEDRKYSADEVMKVSSGAVFVTQRVKNTTVGLRCVWHLCAHVTMSGSTSRAEGYNNPPAFSHSKPYDRWKIEVQAWTKVMKLSKKQQGLAIALSLPEESGARDKVFSEVDTTLEVDNGVKLMYY